MSGTFDSTRRDFDELLNQLAYYAVNGRIESTEAFETARYCFMDTIGCGLLALKYPSCQNMLGPVVPGAFLNHGARVPGTNWEFDPVHAAFNIGTMVRWLDFNDTWLAAEWGHPSDNLGAILATIDYISRQNILDGKESLTMRHVLIDMIKAHEIQGILALSNSFNRVGLDHVLLVRIASVAVSCARLGGTFEEVRNALSHAWIDGGALRTYRHAPNTGSRKSWAAGDASSRGLRLAMIALKGEMGYPTALSADVWGFENVLFKSRSLTLTKKLDCYVMENILFKISFPAEFHAQTAVEAALQLHDQVKNKLNDIEKIVLETQESGYRIINKTGDLNNPADRDHCLQYMVAIPLIYGDLNADHYEDKVATNPEIDRLRKLMVCSENKTFSKEYLEEDKRSIANSVQIFFKDGSCTEKVEIHYPVGHRRRRREGIPLLKKKFLKNMLSRLPDKQCDALEKICESQEKFEKASVDEIMKLLTVNGGFQ